MHALLIAMHTEFLESFLFQYPNLIIHSEHFQPLFLIDLHEEKHLLADLMQQFQYPISYQAL